MRAIFNIVNKDILFSMAVFLTIFTGIFVLNAIDRNLFPSYYLFYVIGIFAFFIFASLDFEVLKIYSIHLYVISIFLLLVVLFIGQVTRGTIRWIPIGSVSFQPSEIVRPFLILFFASVFSVKNIDIKRMLFNSALIFLPILLILIQPSLGVSVLLTIGLFGVVLSKDFDKKHLLLLLALALVALPAFWFILRPYQKERIIGFFDKSDPQGANYNSIQSMIAVGSGKIFGRNLGKGIQTQLEFLPEKQTDFIFAAISEEMGFAGSALLLLLSFVIFWRISIFLENSQSPTARSFISGVFLTLFVQIVIHTGMNMGILPVTGVPYPLVSAGGSSFLGTMTSLGIVYSAYKKPGNKYLSI